MNLTAPFLLTQSFLSELEEGQGSVINMSSIHAQLTKAEFVSYSTSKAALSGLIRVLAIDLGTKIRINAIEPAAVATDMLLDGFRGNPEAYSELASMHPVNRIANPEEIAEVALFLASDQA